MYLVKTTVQDSKIQGKGYFADQAIPMGTIVYFYADEDVMFSQVQVEKMSPQEKAKIEEFAVENEYGQWVLTKSGPFTNHSCNANILPLYIKGLYCDIAVRDIKPGEEITIDYGLFFSSKKWDMKCLCGTANCRDTIGFGKSVSTDIEKLWFNKIQNAAQLIGSVTQPIFDLEDADAITIKNALEAKSTKMIAKYCKFSLINT